MKATAEIKEIRFDEVEGLEETFAATMDHCTTSGNGPDTTIAL